MPSAGSVRDMFCPAVVRVGLWLKNLYSFSFCHRQRLDRAAATCRSPNYPALQAFNPVSPKGDGQFAWPRFCWGQAKMILSSLRPCGSVAKNPLTALLLPQTKAGQGKDDFVFPLPVRPFGHPKPTSPSGDRLVIDCRPLTGNQ